MPGLVDTHCHLDAAEFDRDRDAVAQTAFDGGIDAIVVPAVCRSNFALVAATCQRYVGCVPAFGIHPLYVAQAHPTDLEFLRQTLIKNPAVAIGEIGLDFFVPGVDVERQNFYFSEQLKIANDHDLPVILHVRRAVDAVLKQLRKCKVRGGIAHAFNGSRQQADEFIKLGFKLGFGGAMTFPRANRIRELAATLPLDAIVLETDAPDIPPEWKVGARNTPDQLPRIALTLAGLRGIAVKEVTEATTRNAKVVLPGLTRIH